MKEIDIKTIGINVEARVIKTEWTVEYGEPVFVNVTGKSDEELAEEMMKNNPGLRRMYEEYVREERRKKLDRILK